MMVSSSWRWAGVNALVEASAAMPAGAAVSAAAAVGGADDRGLPDRQRRADEQDRRHAAARPPFREARVWRARRAVWRT